MGTKTESKKVKTTQGVGVNVNEFARLRCSRGCEFSTENIWHRDLKKGMSCPMVINYNRMSGTTYCRRILRKVA